MKVRCGDYKTSYTIKVEEINGENKFKGTNLIIYLKNGSNLEYGKRINITRSFQSS